MRIHRFFSLAAALTALSTSAYAQLTWDPDMDLVNNGGNGTWDTSSNFWETGGANTSWTNGSNAIFGSGTYQVDLTSSGVTVGNLTYGGSGILEFKGATASGSLGDTITIKSGGATWDTGGGEIEFFNDGNNNNTRLSMTSGDTLTVSGGGTFDTGQNPQNNANGTWSVAGATLDVTAATIVRGHQRSIGQFGTVKLADGSIFVQERNSDQTFANDWVLNGTQVSFGNRFNRKSYMTGVISGDARLRYFSGGNYNSFLRLDNASNSWTGGLMVDRAANNTQVMLNTTDGGLGAVPVSFDADNIILKDGGNLRLNVATTIHENRGITLDGGGILASNANVAIDGAITGDGGLQYGYGGGPGGNLTLNGTSSYTGETWLFEGNLIAGTTNAVGQGVLKLGGTEGFARLILNEQSQTLGGIYNNGSQTKQIVNLNAATTGSTAGTLILDVADGESYNAGSATGVNAATDQGNFNIIKNGLGSQELGNLQVAGDVAVNAGTLIVGNNNGTSVMGNASVTGGTLRVDESVTATSYATSGTGILQIGDSATGAAGSIGNVNVTNNNAVVFDRDNASSLTYSGVISGTGSVTYTGGGGAVILGAAQTYTGDTIIDAKQLSAGGVANALSSDSVIRLGGAGTGSAIFQLKGQDQQAGGLVSGTGSQSKDIRNDAGIVDFTLNVATGQSYNYAANVAGGGTINIIKTGDGTQTFSRNGGYTTALGNVTVNGGELIWNNNTASTVSGTFTVGANGILSGSGVSGAAINVNADGTLTGTGTYGATTVAGALNPGNSPGVMSFTDDLTLLSTASTTLELDGTVSGTEYDVLLGDTANTLTADGTLTITLGYTAALNDTFLVFEDWAGFVGSFDSITVNGTALAEGLSLDTSSLLIDGTLTVVPEPGTFALLTGVLALSSIMIRRRREVIAMTS